ncbi:MAG TPA: amidohydrolase family protein, partial [Gemmatimonadaceae bacterium]|nr:amidohydrolase family protein [Gemmatimonadaceae bacterium]
VDVGTSREEAAIKGEEVSAMNEKHGYIPDPDRLRSTFDSIKAAALFERFKRNDTWQVPTLVVFYQEREIAEPGLQASDSLVGYMPELLARYWRSMPVSVATKMVALGDFHSDLVRRLNRVGVPILAGSDSPNPFVYPGFSLHDELALLVRAGLTPAEALRTATINPARFLGLTDSLGTVAVGKVADLVLLDANPLADIGNTKRIRAVIQGGRLMNRDMLDAMLVAAKARAAVNSN